ncbi:hypothetical protein BDV35DRAFT_384921 [Aspergillus flavus]|uniref:Uncharacterized protein n=1 Tax=Aspergillus flavus TaxID=5059 RepID=A0A5N6GGH8_ASPFL|nr:hypothetical protein BDV35DRAFT_384921 [Aspergillus flavus]
MPDLETVRAQSSFCGDCDGIGNHGTTQDNHPSMFEFKDWLKDMSARTKTILSER